MSDRDLRNLYENVRRGDEYVAPQRMENLYNSVINENDNSSLDADAMALLNRDAENTVLCKTGEGIWRGFRIGREIVHELIEELEGMSDKQTLIQKIKQQAKDASIIDDVATSSFRDVLVQLREFIVDSAKLTKENNTWAKNLSIEVVAQKIMDNIKEHEFQKHLIAFMNAKEKEHVEFNLWGLVDDVKGQVNGVHFDLDQHSHMRYMMPAGEAVKARGAAGPGEALLSFIYNGKKPEGAGDILLGKQHGGGDDWTIELKYNQGRIGKEIRAESVKAIKHLFASSVNEYHAYLGSKFAEDDTAGKDNPVYVIPDNGTNLFITRNQIDSAWKAGVENPTFNKLIELGVFLENQTGDKVKYSMITKTKLNGYKAKQKEGTPGFEEGYGALTNMEVLNMSLGKFIKDYSGIKEGSGTTPFDLYGNEGVVFEESPLSEVITKLAGNSDKHKLENLIGAVHIKNYLTHIQPFTWLVVYNEAGAARCIRHEVIVQTDVVSLVQMVHDRGLKFGPRGDSGGFDIRFM